MKTEPPSIIDQAKRQGWECAFFDFRKAKQPGIEYYNAALVRRKEDGLWLVTRRSVHQSNFTYGFNSLMAFKLDNDFNPQFGIPIAVTNSSTNEHFEDPRVCMAPDGRYFLSACNFIIYEKPYWTGAHQVLIEVNQGWQSLRRHDPAFGKNGKNVRNNNGDEKNWLWFFHEGQLHMVYMTDPHTVVAFDNHSIKPVAQWVTHQLHPDWDFGHIRGGTAPVRVGDLYYSFFHSSLPWRNDKRRYFMGAYAFEAKTPFRMYLMTPKPLLTGSQIDPWAEGKPLVVFPCSAILDNDTWTVSMGINDLVSAYVRIPHEDLLERLDPGVTFRAATPDKTPIEKVFK